MTIYIDGHNAQTLLLLHGSGGSAQDLIPIGHKLAPEAALLSIPGRVIENGQRRYFKHNADGGFDLNDLAKQTAWLLNTVDHELISHRRDAAQLTVVGYSNGANIAARATLSGPVPWQRGVFLHAMRLGGEELAARLDDFAGWFSYGTRDALVSEANFHSLVAMFQGSGATTTVFTHQRGHALTPLELEAAAQWLT
ncbi:alpha/beta hydrolase [Lacticaseibacillus jixiensis]|uniref:alpha/beta hydrolase n=1 Tax=Lacticaseibacillus jixiensis TaxID=3231926 RepID=UPI0036F3A0B2